MDLEQHDVPFYDHWKDAMVYMHRIYTRSGDSGKTMLGDGSEIAKTDLRIEAMAFVDQLNAQLGVSLVYCENPKVKKQLGFIQNQLFDFGAELCMPCCVDSKNTTDQNPSNESRITLSDIQKLEEWMDEFTSKQEPLDSFVLPGGSLLASSLHIARTTCRLAEIALWRLHESSALQTILPQYLNRLADFFFVLARDANEQGKLDIKWIPKLKWNV